MSEQPKSESSSAGDHSLLIRIREALQRRTAWASKILLLPEGQLFLLLAVVIGLFSGLAVVCFRVTIEWIRISLLGSSLAPAHSRLFLVPAAVGLVVAFLVTRFFPRARGSGVNQTKAAVYVFDGYVPFSTVIGKFVTCALAIGSGQSLGPEDPSLQMGAGMASALGRRLGFSREKLRLLAPVGAAGGLAAAFNAPISAVLFVIEEVIGTWSAGVLGAIVLAAVSSAVVMRWFLGNEPLFRVPAYSLAHPSELLSYAVLGVAGGLCSLMFLKLIVYLRPKLSALPRWTHYVQPAVAGLLIGIMALWLPQVLGAGYPFVDQALHDQFAWQILLLLGLAKILSTTLSFVSGTPGGMFAPTLFIGAMIGGAVGGLEHHFFPHFGGSVGPFALVGMGTFFAGFLRVPITSVFMVVEASGNYSIVLPVMISNTIAYLISRRYQHVPLFDVLSSQDGMDLPSMEEQREQTTLRVEDAMRPSKDLTLLAADTLARAAQLAEVASEEMMLVSFPSGRWAGITREELRHYAAENSPETPLREVLPSFRLPLLHPDHSLEEALRLLHGRPFLPVVSRANLQRLEGVISLSYVLETYRKSAGD